MLLRFVEAIATHKEYEMLEFTLPDMTCGHCASAVTKAIKAEDANAKVTVSLHDKRVTIETDEPRESIETSLAEAGYPASPA